MPYRLEPAQPVSPHHCQGPAPLQDSGFPSPIRSFSGPLRVQTRVEQSPFQKIQPEAQHWPKSPAGSGLSSTIQQPRQDSGAIPLGTRSDTLMKSASALKRRSKPCKIKAEAARGASAPGIPNLHKTNPFAGGGGAPGWEAGNCSGKAASQRTGRGAPPQPPGWNHSLSERRPRRARQPGFHYRLSSASLARLARPLLGSAPSSMSPPELPQRFVKLQGHCQACCRYLPS